jgi:broad specificity phosphatase PhoE
MTEANQ